MTPEIDYTYKRLRLCRLQTAGITDDAADWMRDTIKDITRSYEESNKRKRLNACRRVWNTRNAETMTVEYPLYDGLCVRLHERKVGRKWVVVKKAVIKKRI